MEHPANILDCETGRKLGCRTLCCRLFVPLTGADVEAGLQQLGTTGMLKQERDGLCTYLDRTTHWCTIWDRRPPTCRGFDCNQDFRLQVVIRDGFHSFTRLIEKQRELKEQADLEILQVPYLESSKAR